METDLFLLCYIDPDFNFIVSSVVDSSESAWFLQNCFWSTGLFDHIPILAFLI